MLNPVLGFNICKQMPTVYLNYELSQGICSVWFLNWHLNQYLLKLFYVIQTTQVFCLLWWFKYLVLGMWYVRVIGLLTGKFKIENDLFLFVFLSE